MVQFHCGDVRSVDKFDPLVILRVVSENPARLHGDGICNSTVPENLVRESGILPFYHSITAKVARNIIPPGFTVFEGQQHGESGQFRDRKIIHLLQLRNIIYGMAHQYLVRCNQFPITLIKRLKNNLINPVLLVDSKMNPTEILNIRNLTINHIIKPDICGFHFPMVLMMIHKGTVHSSVHCGAAIQSNHTMMVDPLACAGNIATNPLRQDIEEAADICGVDFILNVVLDEKKQIIKAVAGDVTKAHREGCAFLDSLYEKKIPQRADIVIVSQGGAPKDLNLYQTQKALDNAKHAVKPGGTILLVGSCQEGLGEHVFEDWIMRAEKPQDLIRWVREDFKLGGHKAAAIAMVLENASISLISKMDPALVRKSFLDPYEDLQKAFDDAFAKYGDKATVLVMPYGGSTLPRCE